MTTSLYIHIPFCARKCDYCGFYSIPSFSDDPILDRYVDVLCDDIKTQLAGPEQSNNANESILKITNVPTVYSGGGSPSLLGAARTEKLFSCIAGVLPNKCTEWTVEVNAESTDEAFLNVCRAAGVTRISLGVQSFNEAARRAIGRRTTQEALERGLELLNKYYAGAFSLDLLSGGSADRNILLNDITKALSYKPAHISLYDLCVETGTPLEQKVSDGGFLLPSGDEAAKIWIAGRDMLENNGYHQYEVSNFAPYQKESAHNINYWRMGNWLGAGAGATGTIIYKRDNGIYGIRRTIKPNIEAYISTPPSSHPPAEIEKLDRATLIKESLMMGFRYCGGPDEILFKERFGVGISDVIPKTYRRWRQRGGNGALVQNDRIALTKNGLLFLNAFLTECFLELT
ncbi:coproporphyrinogen III oxidase [Spirochaetia bacterium]|nr:coproporphyrinogen III oxidase [Spirochaetia bacterium]